jgi:hypothetical protein
MERLLNEIKKINLNYFDFDDSLTFISLYIYIIDGYIYICSNNLVLMLKLENDFPLKNRKIDSEDFMLLLNFKPNKALVMNETIYSKSFQSCSIKTVTLDEIQDMKIIQFSKFIHDKKYWSWHPDEELNEELLKKLNIKKVFNRDNIYEVNNQLGTCPITLYQKNERTYTPILAFCKNKGTII